MKTGKALQNQPKDFSEMEINELIHNHLQHKDTQKNEIVFTISLILSIVLILLYPILL